MIFKRNKTIPDIIIIEPSIYSDNRGLFFESYNQKLFQQHGITNNFIQDNISFSRKGTIRGLHFQDEPMSQAKLVRVIKGIVWDVAVDLRKDSPTVGKWIGQLLSEGNQHSMFIPKGFAHGFVALKNSIFMYKVDNYYSKEHENSIIWNDLDININWPKMDKIILSDKDKKSQTFKEYLYKI